jgi:tRNA 5-methylaminomethyl-2-thiouridine biosynthesis bifunctional protein
MQAVRGQVLYVDRKPQINLRCPILFGHYIAPVNDQTWVMGATFDRNDTRIDPSPDDDQRITAEIHKFLGLNDFTIQSRWAQIRTTTHDRFPFVGSVPDHQNLYLLGGLGSHGIQFGLLLGEILACQLTNAPLPIGKDALEKVTSHRFWKKS